MKVFAMKIFPFVLTLLLAGSALAEEDGDALQDKLASVERLLSGSSVSNQVLNSDNEAAIQSYRLAKSLYDQAVSAAKEGEDDKARELIKRSKTALFDAVEFANLQVGAKRKDKQDYETMRKSVSALMKALDRVSDQKGKHEQNLALMEDLKKRIHDADELYFHEYYRKGSDLLTRALNDIKLTIREMRSGDTLVRSLKFSNVEDEYRYELDRNDTHLMLLDMFLDELPNDRQLDATAQEKVQKAKKQREIAEKYAGEGDYKAAIRELEQSTRDLIDAIRKTGAYIPG
jgi:hypothetical protein